MNRTSAPRRHRGRQLLLLAVGGALLLGGCSFAVYDLPPEEGRYTFTVDQQIDDTTTTTEWDFVSSKVSEDEQDPRYPCLTTVYDAGNVPCRAEPLIFLRYDLGLGLDNTLPAGGRHPITITAYYQDLSSSRLVTDMDVSVSFDDGTSWMPVTVQDAGDNTFTAAVRHPQFDATSGAVALRVHAADEDGNRVDQTILGAYDLRAPGSPGGG